MILRRVSLIAAAALFLGACANGEPGGSSVSSPSASPPAASASPPAASASSAAASASSSAASAEPSGGVTDEQAKTLTGTIAEGVEPGCLVLDGHTLIFDDQSLKARAKAGAKVTVSGRAQPGMMTTCMQGTPFLVTSVSVS